MTANANRQQKPTKTTTRAKINVADKNTRGLLRKSLTASRQINKKIKPQ